MEGRRKMAQELRRCAFVWLVGFALATAFACGGGATLPTGPAGNRSPAIQGVSVEPNAITPGGSAMVVVTARDPEDDRLFYTFHATHGVFAIPDSSQPGRAQYLNNGTAGTDTISVIVSDTKNATVTGTAKISVDRTTGGKPPTPKPTPEPTAAPTHNEAPKVEINSSEVACHPTPTSPCTLAISASASDPDRDPIAYRWLGCASGADQTSTCIVTTLGTYSAQVTVTDSHGAAASASKDFTGVNSAPVCKVGQGSGLVCSAPHCRVILGVTGSDADGDGIGIECDETGILVAPGKCSYRGFGSGTEQPRKAWATDPWNARAACTPQQVRWHGSCSRCDAPN